MNTKTISAVALIGILIIVSVALGLLTAIVNSPWILFLVSPLIFVLVGLKDFRITIVALLIIGILGQSRLLPSFSNFNIFNYLILGATVSLGLKFIADRKPLIWPPKAFALFLIPFTFALLNGILNLKGLPSSASLIEGSAGITAMDYAKLHYVRPMLYVLLSLLIANAINQSKNQDGWAIPYVISCLVPCIAVFGIIAAFGFDLSVLSKNWALLGSIGLHKNTLGATLAFSLAPMLFLLAAVKSHVVKAILVACIAVTGAALLLTFSRGGVTAAIAIWIVFCFYRKSWLALTASIVLVPVIALALPTEILDRLILGLSDESNNGIREDDQLTAGRLWVWQQLLPEIAKRPLFGAGLYGHMWSDLAFVNSVTYPHNFLLQTLIDLGIPGAICMISFYILVMRGFLNLSRVQSLSPIIRALAASGWAMMIGWTVFGLTNSDYIPNKEAIPIWLLMGLLFAHWNKAFKPKTAKQSTLIARGDRFSQRTLTGGS